MQENAFETFGKKRKNSYKGSKKQPTHKNKWFNHDCYEKRREYTKARNQFLRNKNDNTRRIFVEKKNTYNRLKRNTKKIYMRNQRNELAH